MKTGIIFAATAAIGLAMSSPAFAKKHHYHNYNKAYHYDNWFDYADKNNDGIVTKREARRADRHARKHHYKYRRPANYYYNARFCY